MQLPAFPVPKSPSSDRYLVPTTVLVRGIAYLIDFSLITVLLSLLLPIAGVDVNAWLQSFATGELSASAVQHYTLVVWGAQIVYFWVWEATVAWTPGKRVFQVRVVNVDGTRCGVLQTLVRNVILPVDLFFFVGVISMILGFRRQRFGDRAARTLVVRETPMALIPPPFAPADIATRRCPRCGMLAGSGAADCPVCGVNMDEAQRAWQQGLPPFLAGPFGARPQPGAPPGRQADDPPHDDAELDRQPADDAGYGEGWDDDEYDAEAAYLDEDGPAAESEDAAHENEEEAEAAYAGENADAEDAAYEGEEAAEAAYAGENADAEDAAFVDEDEAEPAEAGAGQEQAAETAQTGSAGSAAPARPTRRAAAASRRAGDPAAAAQRRAFVSQDRSQSLVDEDEFERGAAAREILLDGTKDEVRLLARILPKWDEDDREFVIAVARTLDGWRPTLVLEALRNDADPEVREAAKEALERVAERNAQKSHPFDTGD